jgi:hypothetical protein
MTVPDHYQVKYSDTFESRLQQKVNRLAPYVTVKADAKGKVCFLDQIQPIDLDQKTSRHEKSQLTEPDTVRRAMVSKTFHKMIGFDEDDDFKLNSQNVPMPESAMQLMYGAQRSMEKVVIDGISGVNQVGNGANDLLTTEAFPSANEVAVTEGVASGNANMPIDKVMAAIEKLMIDEAYGQSNDDGLEMPCLAMGPSQLIDLIRQTKAVSKDYQPGDKLALFSGRLEQILGCKILLTNQLDLTGSIRTCLAWVKQSVGFGLWKNYNTHLWVDESTGGPRFRVHMACGASRRDTKGVVKLFADETKKTAA